MSGFPSPLQIKARHAVRRLAKRNNKLFGRRTSMDFPSDGYRFAKYKATRDLKSMRKLGRGVKSDSWLPDSFSRLEEKVIKRIEHETNYRRDIIKEVFHEFERDKRKRKSIHKISRHRYRPHLFASTGNTISRTGFCT